jgi:hypothetical protein
VIGTQQKISTSMIWSFSTELPYKQSVKVSLLTAQELPRSDSSAVRYLFVSGEKKPARGGFSGLAG